VIVYSPMASGLLTGAMTRERAANLPKDDWRRGEFKFQHAEARAKSRAGRKAPGDRQTPRSRAGRGRNCLDASQPGVTGAIVGARNARQAEGVMRAGELRLADKEVDEIENLSTENDSLKKNLAPSDVPRAALPSSNLLPRLAQHHVHVHLLLSAKDAEPHRGHPPG